VWGRRRAVSPSGERRKAEGKSPSMRGASGGGRRRAGCGGWEDWGGAAGGGWGVGAGNARGAMGQGHGQREGSVGQD
jgi:hypothetical protein